MLDNLQESHDKDLLSLYRRSAITCSQVSSSFAKYQLSQPFNLSMESFDHFSQLALNSACRAAYFRTYNLSPRKYLHPLADKGRQQ